MDIMVNSLWNDITNLAVGWKIFLGIILIVVQLLIGIGAKNLYILITEYIKYKNKSTKNNDKISQAGLFNHPLFFSISHMVNHRIKTMDFGDKCRNKIFTDLLNIQLNSFLTHSKKMLENRHLIEMTKDEFRCEVFKMFNEIMDDVDYEFEKKYNKDIAELILNHPDKGFNVRYETITVYTKSLMEDICDSSILNTLEKLHTIFNAYHSALDAILVNVEKTMYAFNGELTDLIKRQNNVV